MRKAAEALEGAGVAWSAYVVSAHRTPGLLDETLRALEGDGTEVIIAGAGLAAHLPGVIASRTLLPVVGVPISAGTLGGLDALLSMVQMPQPVPVATVGVDNAANAAQLALRILALKYPDLKKRLEEARAKTQSAFAEQNAGFSLL
jgi:5-(carboxyamino)imidazole ribonucleotide mutase